MTDSNQRDLATIARELACRWTLGNIAEPRVGMLERIVADLLPALEAARQEGARGSYGWRLAVDAAVKLIRDKSSSIAATTVYSRSRETRERIDTLGDIADEIDDELSGQPPRTQGDDAAAVRKDRSTPAGAALWSAADIASVVVSSWPGWKRGQTESPRDVPAAVRVLLSSDAAHAEVVDRVACAINAVALASQSQPRTHGDDAAALRLEGERDEARATARTLAHAYQSDNRPNAFTVARAMSYPVVAESVRRGQPATAPAHSPEDDDPGCPECGHAESLHRPQLNGGECGASVGDSGRCYCRMAAAERARKVPPKDS